MVGDLVQALVQPDALFRHDRKCCQLQIRQSLRMVCPELAGLPPAPRDRAGWPWTEGGSALPRALLDGRPWPRISIVTPSFNQGQFIEETIRSVLLQGYPNLEYMVIDGGSTDNSVEIIKKYESWLAYWVSEKDRGQSHAINKGFAKTTGDILAWLNSDDFYMPGTLGEVATEVGKGRGIVIGNIAYVDETSCILQRTRTNLNPGGPSQSLLKNYPIDNLKHSQAAMFWTREVHLQAQPLAENLDYVMDFDFLLRAVAQGVTPRLVNSLWSGFRRHRSSKGCSKSPVFNLEAARLYWRSARRPGFCRGPCLRLTRLNLGYYCQKRIALSAQRRRYLCAMLWVAGAICAVPSWGSCRSNVGAFLRAAKGKPASGDMS